MRAVRANVRTEERMAQYSTRQFHLVSTHCALRLQTPLRLQLQSHEILHISRNIQPLDFLIRDEERASIIPDFSDSFPDDRSAPMLE